MRNDVASDVKGLCEMAQCSFYHSPLNHNNNNNNINNNNSNNNINNNNNNNINGLNGSD